MDNPDIEKKDGYELRSFLSEFRRRLTETKTDKMLIRLINNNIQAFGPHSTGSNILINRFIKREESMIYKAEQIIEKADKILEESKLPNDMIKLSAAYSVDSSQ